MARYKTAIYDVTYYGEGDANVIAYDSAITATQVTYDKIKLTWKTVTQDVTEEGNPQYYKIVRTTGGSPDSPYLGEVIVEGSLPSGLDTYTDTTINKFPSGTQVTYSYWILNSSDVWRYCGGVEVTSVSDDRDTTYKLMSLLPQTWVNSYGTIGDATGTPDIPELGTRYFEDGTVDHKYDLWALLNSLSFYYDKLSSEISAFQDYSDFFSYPRRLLTYAVDELQFSTEPSLGDQYHRSLYKSGNLINSLKGTKLGIERFGGALTHTAVEAIMGSNLMLDYNDSSFEESVGNWTGNAVSVSSSISNRAYADDVVTITTSSAHNLYEGAQVLIAMNSDKLVCLEKTTNSSAQITLSWTTYNNANTPVDMSGGVTLKITDTNGTEITDLTSSLSHTVGTGVYSATYTLPGVGTYVAKWVGTDTTYSQTDSEEFNVEYLYAGTYTVVSIGSTTAFSYVKEIGTFSESSTAATGTVSFSPEILTAHKYINTVNEDDLNLDTVLDSPIPNFISSYVRTEGFGLITAWNSGTITLQSWGDNSITKSIPVKPGKSYHFCGYVKGPTGTTGVIKTRLVWFDRYGEVVDYGAYGTSISVNDTWKYFDASEATADIVAPTGTCYAGIEIVVTGLTVGNNIYIDMLSFSEFPGLIGNIDYGYGETVYEDARTVHVQMPGYRTNYIHNPSFEAGTSSWYTKDSTLVRSDAYSVIGDYSGKLELTASTGYLISEWMTSEDETYYTASMYVRGTGDAELTLEFSSPFSLENQATLLYTGSESTLRKYYNTNPYSTTSETLTLTNSWQRISVTAQSPEHFIETPKALMKVYLSVTGTSGDIVYIDGAMLEDSAELQDLFTGDGYYSPELDKIISLTDCRWEERLTLNFVENPSFESALSGWSLSTSGGGNSIASATPGVGEPTAKYGSKVAKVITAVTDNVASKAINYPKRTTAVFPEGGESLSASVDVAGPAGTYSISLDNSTWSSYVLPGDLDWVRISTRALTVTDAETVTVYVKYSGTGTWFMDGAQVEFGKIATSFVGPHNGTAITMRTVTGGTPGTTTMYGAVRELVSSGRSYYWPNFDSKSSRLITGSRNMVLNGSTVALDLGDPEHVAPELPFSVIKSSSLESSLYGWTAGANTTVTRVVGRGSLFDEVAATGSSWMELTNTSAQTMSVIQSDIEVSDGRYYDISAAFKITGLGNAGVASVIVEWFDENGDSISSETVDSVTIDLVNEWVYVGNKNKTDINRIVDPGAQAVTAELTLEFNPTASSGAQTVLIDRVVFQPTLY